MYIGFVCLLSVLIHLAGGTGFIGSSLSKLLENRGYIVASVSRIGGPNRVTWEDISCEGLPDDVDAVINVAGQNVLDVTKLWTNKFKKEVIDSRVETTSLLSFAIEEAKVKPKLYITISGVGIYEPDLREVYDESHDVGTSFDFISKLAHEWETAAKLTTKDVRQIIVRSGVVLGRNGGMIPQIYWPFYFGFGGPIGSGHQPFPWIHLHDLCRIFLYCIKNEKMNGIVNAVAPQIITNKEFATAFAKSLSRPAILPLPASVVQFIFGKERAAMLLYGQKVIPKKLVDSSFTYWYPNIDSACTEVARMDPRMSEVVKSP